MNREDIVNAFYETIKDSTEWGISCDDRTYAYFVDGVVAMTEKMIDLYCNMPMTDYDDVRAVMD